MSQFWKALLLGLLQLAIKLLSEASLIKLNDAVAKAKTAKEAVSLAKVALKK